MDKKVALVHCKRITATVRTGLVSPPCEAVWLPRAGGVLEKQMKKGRGEENWNKETAIYLQISSLEVILSTLYLKQVPILPPSFLEYKVK